MNLSAVREARPDPEGSRGRSLPLRRLLEIIVLVGLPLTSRASLWGGATGAMWPELLALPVWIAAISAGRRRWASAGRGAWPAILLYVAAVVASTLIVLSEQHRIGSPALAENLTGAIASWFGAWSTADPLYPLRSAVVYIAGPLFFVAVRVVWDSGRPPALFERLILWGGAVAASVAIIQAVSGRGLFPESALGGPVVFRAAGPLPDPNAFASYLALAAAFGAVVWAARLDAGGVEARTRSLVTAGAWGTLIAGGLWFSGSRAAVFTLVGLLVGWLVTKALKSPARGGIRTRLAAGVAVILLGLVGLVGVASVGGYGNMPDQSRLHRFLSTFDVGQSTMRMFRGRPVLWQAGVTMVADEPVVGIGSGRYGVELGNRLPVELWGVTTAENAHNYYLQAAAENGLVSLLALVLLLAVAARALWEDRAQMRARATLFGALAWCLTCVVGHPQLIPSLQLFFWGFVGMATAGHRLPRLGPGRAGVLIVLALLAGRVGQEALSASSGPSLYAAGLHQREPAPPGGETLRWTASHSRLDLRREGNVVELRFFVAHDEFPVTVRSAVGPWFEERRYFDGGWKTLAYYVPLSPSDRLPISLDTSPSFSPAGDSRDLGVMLAPLRWYRGGLREPLGTYPPEREPDGRLFRWTSGVACFPLAGSGDIEVGLRADNPDLETRPLVVILTTAEGERHTVRVTDRAWTKLALSGSESAAAEVLCVQTSRTWNPRAETGSADSRDLGVAISISPETAVR